MSASLSVASPGRSTEPRAAQEFARSAKYSIQDVSVTGGSYQSTGELSSSGTTIKSGSPVLFQSDSNVVLGGGFSVESGAVFTAAIAPCN